MGTHTGSQPGEKGQPKVGALLLTSLGFYALCTTLGLLLRYAFLQPLSWLEFGNALHAHSHTLYFGWLGLAVTVLAYRAVGASRRAIHLAGGALTVISVGSFVAFLHSGYSAPGIAVSTAALVVWAAIIRGFFKASSGQRGLHLSFLRWGFAYIGLASLGAVARTVLLAAKIDDPLLARLTVFAFLHCFSWFFALSSIGLLVHHLEGRNLLHEDDARWLQRTLPFIGVLAWTGFPLAVPGGAEGLLGLFSSLGALVMVVACLPWVRALWRASRRSAQSTPGDAPLRLALRMTCVWLAFKLAMEVGGALGLSSMAAAVRQPVILYLHVELVGFVTLALLVPVCAALRRPLSVTALWLHTGGLAVMVAGLGLASLALLGVTAAHPVLEPLNAVVPWAMHLAALGGAGIVAAALLFLFPLPRHAPVLLPHAAR